jgi:hypothetical protein
MFNRISSKKQKAMSPGPIDSRGKGKGKAVERSLEQANAGGRGYQDHDAM